MSTYKSSYNKRRRRINFKLIAALFALIGAIGAITTGTINFSTAKKLDKEKTAIETIKQETINIEAQIPNLEASIKELSKEVSSLQNILWRYEPTVVPDSMK
ncbi:MAG: hypothetical protein RSD26_09790 [Cellulosilyticaceae bacterium]